MLTFTSLDQVRPGLLWVSPRLDLLNQYHSLWRNDVSSRSEATAVKVNWYRRVTDFWVDGLWGKPPSDIKPEIARAFERASEFRSIKGNGVLIVDSDTKPRVVDPSNWHPVYDPLDAERVTGHIISYFHHASAVNPGKDESTDPDRATMLLLDADGNGEKVLFEVEGNTLGRQLSREAAALYQIVYWGDGVSDYTDIRDIVTEYEHRYSRWKRVLDRHSDPHLSGPEEALSADGIWQATADGQSMFLPLSAGAEGYNYVTYDGAQTGQQAALNVLLDNLHISTSIPATAFGLNDTSSSSGVSRERQLFAALQKLRRLRREMTEALMSISSEQNIDWPDTPFSGYVDMAESEIALVAAGITTADEARQHLGIDES